jgi:hypothetical protein
MKKDTILTKMEKIIQIFYKMEKMKRKRIKKKSSRQQR